MLATLSRVRFLRAVRPQLDFLSGDEMRALLEALPARHFHAMTLLALNTGMRLGELLALTWPAVDLGRQRILIWQSLNDNGSLGSPKSGRNRKIPLNVLAIDALSSLSRET